MQILAVNLTFNDSKEAVQAFVDKYGFTFPVLLDEQGEAADKYHVKAIPSTFFVSSEGKIVDQVVGAASAEVLSEKVESLVGK